MWGGAEIAKPDIARPDNARPYSKGGHCDTGQRRTRSNSGFGALADFYYVYTISTNTADLTPRHMMILQV